MLSSNAALVVAELGRSARLIAGACSSGRQHGRLHRAAGRAPSSTAALVVAKPGGIASPVVEVRLCRPTRAWQALSRQSASGGGRPCGDQARTACVEGHGGSPPQPDACGWSLCAEGFGSVRRVRFPATPGLVLGRVGRVEGATQWELASAVAFPKPALDLADGTVSSMCRLVSGPIGLRLGGNGRRDVRRVGGLPSARRAESLVPGTARGRSPSTEFGLWY